MEHPARADPRLGRADPRAARRDRRGIEPSDEPLSREILDAATAAAAHAGRHAPRRLRRRAEVPAGLGPRAPARPAAVDGRRRGDARRDGPRRHLRPGRRRLPPLLGRRRSGSSRTSRRCSTTTRCSPAPTCTPGRRSATSATGGSARRRSSGRCARCAARRAASTPRWTPTPRARRAASTSGPRTRSARRSRAPASRALADEVIAYYGVTEEGNFEGRNILHVPGGPARRAARGPRRGAPRALHVPVATRLAGQGRQAACSWNALMIGALAEAGAALAVRDYLDAAVACAEFVWRDLRDDRGRLLRTYKDGQRAPRRLPRGLRVPGRGAPDPLRGDVRRPLVRRRARDRRPDDRAVRRRRARRLLHHRPRPRGAGRAAQGRRRPPDPVGQLRGRLRPPTARGADRRARVRAPRRRRLPPAPPGGRQPPAGACAPAAPRWTSTSRRSRRWHWWASPRATASASSRRSSAPVSGRTWCSRADRRAPNDRADAGANRGRRPARRVRVRALQLPPAGHRARGALSRSRRRRVIASLGGSNGIGRRRQRERRAAACSCQSHQRQPHDFHLAGLTPPVRPGRDDAPWG